MRRFVRTLSVRTAVALAGVALASTAWAGSHDEGGADGAQAKEFKLPPFKAKEPGAQQRTLPPFPARERGEQQPPARRGQPAAERKAEKPASEQPTETTKAEAGGMFAMVVESLGEVDVRPEQKEQINTLAEEAEVRHEPFVAAMHDLMTQLADQVEAGEIDRDALEDQMEDLEEAWSCVRAGDLAALEVLHGILDAKQRDQLATALGQRIEKHIQEHESMAWVDELADKLDMTDNQRDQLALEVCKITSSSEFAAAKEEKRNRVEAMLNAFRSDEFDANAIASKEEDTAGKRIDKMLGLAETVVGILDEEQRAAAADLIREKVNADEAQAAGAPEQKPGGAQPGEENIGESSQEVAYGRGWGGWGGRGGWGGWGGYRGGWGGWGGYRGGWGYPGVYGGHYGYGYPGYGYGYRRSYGAYYSGGYPFGAGWGWGGWGWGW